MEWVGREFDRISWRRDAVLVGLWLLWILFLTGIGGQDWFKVSGLPLLLIYSAWWWSFRRAAAFFLLMSWLYGSVSLMPSGLFWLSLFGVYSFMRIAQSWISVRQIGHLALLAALVSLVLECVQLVLLIQLYAQISFSWDGWLAMLSRAFLHGILGFMLYPIYWRWVLNET